MFYKHLLFFLFCQLKAASLDFIDIMKIFHNYCQKVIPHPKISENRGTAYNCSPTRSIDNIETLSAHLLINMICSICSLTKLPKVTELALFAYLPTQNNVIMTIPFKNNACPIFHNSSFHYAN